MNRRADAVQNWRNRTKKRLIDYKGGKCEICGYCKDVPSCYDFHHKDPKEKLFSISHKNVSFENVIKEVDKCALLCKNCHSELHWNLNQEKRLKRQKEVRKDILPDFNCEECNKQQKKKDRRQKYCSLECSRLARRKVKRPSKDELNDLLNKNSYCAVGRMFGVSDNTIRKWLK